VKGTSVLNEYVAPNVSPPPAIAASLSILLFRPPLEAGTGQGDAFLAAFGAALVPFSASSRRSSLAQSSDEYEEPIAAHV
jgi:hypothetical protein